MGTILDELLKDPTRIGVVFLLLLIVVAFFKEWIVPGTSYTKALAAKDVQIEAARKDGEFYRAIAFKFAEITERTQQVREERKP